MKKCLFILAALGFVGAMTTTAQAGGRHPVRVGRPVVVARPLVVAQPVVVARPVVRPVYAPVVVARPIYHARYPVFAPSPVGYYVARPSVWVGSGFYGGGIMVRSPVVGPYWGWW